MESKKIRVLVVDDSAVIRQLLTQIFDTAGDIEVVGCALDPLFALGKIPSLSPDVITLDVEMPRMDGITFLEKLMRENPIPVVMVSSLTQRGSDRALRALELGAVDVVGKPLQGGPLALLEMGEEIIAKVRAAAQSRPRAPRDTPRATPLPGSSYRHAGRVVAIGASTGGTEAVRTVLSMLPENSPPILVVQHISPYFVDKFATSLDSSCRLKVRVAAGGEILQPGMVYVAPGNNHMGIRLVDGVPTVEVGEGPKVCNACPSVDILFRSLAAAIGRRAMGVLLTGMGEDGARGLLEIRNSGGRTIAQDKESCVVFGMPRQAIALSAAEKVAALDDIGGLILR